MRVRASIATLLMAGCASSVPQMGPVGPLGAALDVPVYDESTVDTPVRPIYMPKPVYPPKFQMAGRCGYAQVKYVVGLDGRAEPATITIVDATDRAFGNSAAEAIRKSD